MTVGTEHTPHPTVVWVTVEKVRQLRTLWTHRLPEDKPGSPGDGTIPISSSRSLLFRDR